LSFPDYCIFLAANSQLGSQELLKSSSSPSL
jgi:hypothetical protein